MHQAASFLASSFGHNNKHDSQIDLSIGSQFCKSLSDNQAPIFLEGSSVVICLKPSQDTDILDCN